MKKEITFDLDTKKYEKATGRSAPTAYYKIQRYMERHDFVHRQGSVYISKNSMSEAEVTHFSLEMSIKLPWLKECVREIDVTNIGKRLSLLDIVHDADNIQNISQEKSGVDLNIANPNKNQVKDFELDISNK